MRHGPRAGGSTTVPLLNEAAECVEYVQDGLKSANEAALTYIDIDGLLVINTVYGAHVGDLVLGECTELIRRHYSGFGHVCRLRGDQFVVAEATEDPRGPTWRAEQALVRIRTHDWSNLSPDLHVSATGSTAYRQPGEDIPSLLLRAILGVKTAKRLGKDNFADAPIALPKFNGDPKERWKARIAQIPKHLSDDYYFKGSYDVRLRLAGFSNLEHPVKKPDGVVELEHCRWCGAPLKDGRHEKERRQIVDHHTSPPEIIEYVREYCPNCEGLNDPTENS